jgi:RimJ/RimL family protein N-acetyltransferase
MTSLPRDEPTPMTVLETTRLRLDRLTPEDAEFIFELVNEPAWIRYIGDKKVRTHDDARAYILSGPMQSYDRFGFGLYRTALKDSGTPIGICGLLKRDGLTDVDVGFAFLARFWGRGYAHESVSAVLAYGRGELGLKRIAAITTPDNLASIKVLEKAGMRFERRVRLSGDSTELSLFLT